MSGELTMIGYNFRTKEYEAFDKTRCDDYVPRDNPAALSLYHLYVEDEGMAPIEALKAVLLLMVPAIEAKKDA